MQTPQSRKQGGFTLIELMMVVVLVGIIIAMAVPSFTAYLQRKRLEGASNELRSLISYARSEALRTNADTFLIVTRASNDDWSIVAANANGCSVGAACDLRSLNNVNTSNIQLLSGTSSTLTAGATTINRIDNLLTFNGGATTAQSFLLGSGPYQAQVGVTMTGVTSVCTPSGQPSIAGISAC